MRVLCTQADGTQFQIYIDKQGNVLEGAERRDLSWLYIPERKIGDSGTYANYFRWEIVPDDYVIPS